MGLSLTFLLLIQAPIIVVWFDVTIIVCYYHPFDYRLIDCFNSHIRRCKKSRPWSQGRKTPFGRKERTTYSPFKKKAAMVQKTTCSSHLVEPLHRYMYKGVVSIYMCYSQEDGLNTSLSRLLYLVYCTQWFSCPLVFVPSLCTVLSTLCIVRSCE